MAHSPLKRILASVMDVARLRNAHGVSTEAALALQHERRKLLTMSAAGSVAMLASSPLLSAAAMLGSGGGRGSRGSNMRVVVVGAGLGGLACAYELKKAGLSATVYEASDRLG